MTSESLKTKAGIDTTNFKTGIAAMNRELRVLESGFRASAAGLGDWANDATGLESRIKTLNSSMDIQKQKVAAVRTEYERVKAESGENSRAAQDLEIKLNKETETLGKMGVELQTTEGALQEVQSGSDEAGNSVDELGTSTEETGGKMEGFKSVLGGVGAVVEGTVGLVLGLAGAVAGVTLAISGLVLSAATAGSDLQDMSDKTGISTQRLQELTFIGNQTGTSIDTITGANARLIRSMAGAQDQSQSYAQKVAEAAAAGKDIEDIDLGDVAKAFEQLGVSVTDANGNLRDNNDVFADAIDAFGKIQNPAERDALAMQIFGKSAQELNPLFKLGSDGMADMADNGRELGAIMSDETVAGLDNFDDTLTGLQDGLKGTLGTLAGAFLPGFQGALDQAGGYIKTFTDIVSGSDGDFGKIAEGLTGLVTQIATDIAAQAPQMLNAGLAIVNSILDAIIQALPAMLDAGIGILTALIDFIIQSLPTLIDAGIKIVLFLVNALIDNLPKLIDAALQAIITLANGLAEALPTLIPAVVEAIITIVNTLIENLPMLITAAMTLLQALADGLIVALPVLIAAVPQIFDVLLTALIDFLPQLTEMGLKLVATLVGGIVASLPVLVLGLVKLNQLTFEKLQDLVKKIPEIGKGFVNGIIDGINNAKGLLFDTVVNMATDMVLSIRNALTMKSPSGVGKGIGKNFIGSIGLGGEESMREVERAFANMAGRFSQATSLGLAGGVGGNTSSVNSEHYSFFAPVTIGAGAGSLGETLKGRRF